MGKIEVYGHSDDCIEVEGDLMDEGYVGDDGRGVVVVTSRGGTTCVLDVHYGPNGVWRIEQRQRADGLSVDIVKGPDEEDETGYTDRATVTGRIYAVEIRKRWPPTRSDKIEEIEAELGERADPALVDAMWAEVRRSKGSAG